MDSILDRLSRSITQRGVLGTLKLCAVVLGWKVFPNFRRVESSQRQADADFDKTYGVDTGGVFRPKRDEVMGENWALGGNYQAINPAALETALRSVQIPYENFTFIDFGSGKGRTVLIASRFPFHRVIGVEYCPKLNEIARKNVAQFPASEKRCRNIELVDADATQYAIPDEPLLILLNNPFAEPVMAGVVRNVADSYRRYPRRMVLIYFWPDHARLWEETGIFQRIQKAPAVFKVEPAHSSMLEQPLKAA